MSIHLTSCVRWLICAVLCLLVTAAAPAAFCQEPADQPVAAADESESVRFYTFIDASPEVPAGILQRLTGHRPAFVKGARPMVQWMIWANKPKPPLRSWLFILFFAVIAWSAAPTRMRAAAAAVRAKFWPTLLIGALVGIIGITIVRVGVQSLIGWPAGIVALGILQLSMLAGLSVVASVLGQTTAGLLRLQNWPIVGQRQSVRRFLELMLGALICALLLQIPPVGILPRIGTRLVTLLAVLGLGGLYRARILPGAPAASGP